ncbi:hypothetical protein CN172_31845 [Sinorhizobium meliloti]|nr:hypothetical protein C5N13_04390 [Sinorhizobium meliloti]RMC63573.1 hypothetical protein EBB04_28135 [Sinorhizobium meliloti]RVE89009.1 hypothetical protein CN232_32830 [Sinorhizobium meliloti]RVG05898.1 hypothetical protein CN230_26125 [Sinorhizobium meliloti]RVG19816.1 hypothetical protein CN231_05910 [Sinorhizobium meliloti]
MRDRDDFGLPEQKSIRRPTHRRDGTPWNVTPARIAGLLLLDAERPFSLDERRGPASERSNSHTRELRISNAAAETARSLIVALGLARIGE